MKWRDLDLMERTPSLLGGGQGPHKAGGADRQVESPGSQGQSPPSEHFLDNFRPPPPPPLPNHLEPGQSSTLGFPACPSPLGRDTPRGSSVSQGGQRGSRKQTLGSRWGWGRWAVPCLLSFPGRTWRGSALCLALTAWVSPHPGTLQCSPTTSPCTHGPLHPLVHAGNTSFLLGTL